MALAGLADVIHGLVAALPAILILELVQMCLQPLFVLQIVLEEDFLLRLTRNESVLNRRTSLALAIEILEAVFLGAAFATGYLIAQ